MFSRTLLFENLNDELHRCLLILTVAGVNFELAIKDRAPFCDKPTCLTTHLLGCSNLQLYHTGEHLALMGCSNFFLPSKDERGVDKDQILGSSSFERLLSFIEREQKLEFFFFTLLVLGYSFLR